VLEQCCEIETEGAAVVQLARTVDCRETYIRDHLLMRSRHLPTRQPSDQRWSERRAAVDSDRIDRPKESRVSPSGALSYAARLEIRPIRTIGHRFDGESGNTATCTVLGVTASAAPDNVVTGRTQNQCALSCTR